MKPTLVRFILLGRYMFSLNQQLQKLCRSVGEMHTQWQKKWCSNALNVFAHIHFLLKYSKKKTFGCFNCHPTMSWWFLIRSKCFHCIESNIRKVYSNFDFLSEWHFMMEKNFAKIRNPLTHNTPLIQLARPHSKWNSTIFGINAVLSVWKIMPTKPNFLNKLTQSGARWTIITTHVTVPV